MSQSFTSPITGALHTAVQTLLLNNDLALRSLHSGGTAPTSTVAYMFWADTATNLLKQRNSTDNGWVVLGPLGGNAGRLLIVTELGTVNASVNKRVVMLPCKATIIRISLWSDTTSTGSSGGATEYRWQLRNLTTSLNLFSGNVGTGTVLGGVGGGEITANTPYPLVANQNQDAADGDRFEFQITKLGAPTSLTTVSAYLDFYERG